MDCNMSQEEKKICFVIAPIGNEESAIRYRSDRVMKYIIEPAVDDCGYKAIRADIISDPGMITTQIIQHLIDDPLVIADLTEHNPNVCYELAIRHFARKPCIQIIESEERIPFDIKGIRTIRVDYRDLESANRCKIEIINQIHSIEKNPDQIETPITFAINQKFLRQSDNPLEKGVVEIISILQELKSDSDSNFVYLADEINDLYSELTKKD